MTLDAGPPTRWEQEYTGQDWADYADRFAREFAEGVDHDGEARFLDVLAPRGAAILDAGCGTGRVAAGLHRRGHRVVGVDRDAGLLAIAARQYPEVRYLRADLGSVTADVLRSAGAPERFDVVAVPGNVMVFLAPGSERDVLTALATLLVPGGRLVTGFATDRVYRVADFDADCAAVGLVLEHRFATWHLDPWMDDAGWVVSVLRAPAGAEPDPL
ncbi:class I SAM-dependent methyltransferase [Nakamurella flavida]|uniref:Class I SAM-dependent methyltransferase n=1 Tax=Nakamurella flavida TaxID=363630 RepID=A0A938YPC4_9ACTN|nr:class I SAM-dependent methyltransferase [Nakamurella flavida]MBM9476914.1 class I SAM-dependent methyltransferase [Nakamurella flavida]MDP9779859.1 SAM-dependent methyltransferase [Nakamurella flavida]